LRWKHATPVIHPFPAKENPRSDAAGVIEFQVARSRLCGAAREVRCTASGTRGVAAERQPPTSALMMSPNSSHFSPLNFIS
jgi:hypothetical protein